MDAQPGRPQPLRRRAVLLGVAGALLGLVVAGPWLLTPVVRAKLLGAIEDQLLVRASLEHVSWDWSGHVELRGLRLERPDQEPVLSVGVAEAEVALLRLLFGEPDFELTVDGFQMWARRDASGTWDLSHLVREHTDEDERAASHDGGGSGGEHGGLTARIRLRGGRLNLDLDGRTARLDRITGDLDVEARGPRLVLDVRQLEVLGRDDEGAEGTFRFGGSHLELPRGGDGTGELVDLAASAERFPLGLTDVLLQGVGPLRGVEGRLSGKGAARWSTGRLEEVAGDWKVEGARLVGPRDPATDLGTIALSLVDEDPGAELRPHVRLDVGDLGHAEVVFETSVLPAGSAVLTFQTSAGGIGRALRSWVPMPAGTTWLGSADGKLTLSSRFEGLRPVALSAKGSVSWTALGLIDAEGTQLDLSPLDGGRLDLAAAFDPTAGRLKLEQGHVAAGPLALDAAWELAGLRPGEPLVGDGRVESSLELSGAGPALVRLLELGERHLSGRLESTVALRVDPEGTDVDGRLTGTDVRIVDPAPQGGTVSLASVRSTLAARYEDGPDALAVRELVLESVPLHGTFRGTVSNVLGHLLHEGEELVFSDLAGEGAYVPDELASALGSSLPARLEGASEEPFSFHAEGHTDSLDLVRLATGSRGDAKLELGRMQIAGMDARGNLSLALEGGQVFWTGKLSANGGSLELEGDLGLGEGSRAPSLRVDTKQVGLTQALAPLLGRIHPAFALVDDAKKGSLSGILTGDLQLSFRGEWSPHLLELSWRDFPKELLSGKGRLDLQNVKLSGSRLFEDAARMLKLDLDRGVDVHTIEFTLDAGRLAYARPWTWTIDGVPTTFTGSVGLDGGLTLMWNVPIGPELLGDLQALAPLAGTELHVPIRGTTDAPQVQIDKALEDLGFGGLVKALRDGAVGEVLNELPKLGGGDEPAVLLREADRLWDADKKAEAAVLYRRIREEFQLSLVYALHSSRIKKRAKYEQD